MTKSPRDFVGLGVVSLVAVVPSLLISRRIWSIMVGMLGDSGPLPYTTKLAYGAAHVWPILLFVSSVVCAVLVSKGRIGERGARYAYTTISVLWVVLIVSLVVGMYQPELSIDGPLSIK